MKKKVIQFGISISAIAGALLLFQQNGWMADYLPVFQLEAFWPIFLLLYGISVLVTSFLLILEHNRPTKTLAWLLVIIFLPFAGLILYLFFGFNYRKQKRFLKKSSWDLKRSNEQKEQLLTQLREKPEAFFSDFENPFFVQNTVQLLLNNSEAFFSNCNRVEVIKGGSEKRQKLLNDLSAATDHIHLEYYILNEGEFLAAVWEKLIEKAKEGIVVRVLYDDVGSWNLKSDTVDRLQRAGGELATFLPVRFPLLTSRFNYRNHRKIVVIDGRIGYTGGININDHYLDDHPQAWRDTHLRLEGEAVRGLQKAFLQDWQFTTKQHLKEGSHFPSVEVQEKTLVQVVASGPDTDYPGIMHAYFNAICTARKYVYITTPYFVPNESMLTAIKTAALGGVDVRLLIPAKGDSRMVSLTARSYLENLLEAGVKIYYYQKSFIHCKVLIVDDIFASVGTANMDIRSFETNFEINAVVYDKKTNDLLKTHFMEDLENSSQLDLERFRKRSIFNKLWEGMARLIAPLL